MEIGFAICFTNFLIDAIVGGQWLAAPFLVFFAAGFAYVGLCSIAQWFRQLRMPGRDTGGTLPA